MLENIIKQFALSNDNFIKHDIISSLSSKEFEIIKNILELKTEYLQYIECFGVDCYDDVEVKTKDNMKYIHCPECHLFEWIENGEDAAYKLTLDSISNMLAKLLNIEVNKDILEFNEVIYFGKNEIEDLGNININYVTIRSEKGYDIFINRHRESNPKNITLLISLIPIKQLIEQRLAQCNFLDLVFYDKRNEKFSINHRVFTDSLKGCYDGQKSRFTQKYLENRCVNWLKSLIKDKKIKHGDKANIKEDAKEYFGLKDYHFEKIWSKIAPKRLKKKGRVGSK